MSGVAAGSEVAQACASLIPPRVWLGPKRQRKNPARCLDVISANLNVGPVTSDFLDADLVRLLRGADGRTASGISRLGFQQLAPGTFFTREVHGRLKATNK